MGGWRWRWRFFFYVNGVDLKRERGNRGRRGVLGEGFVFSKGILVFSR
jgi:hypothetical protein